MKTKDFFLSQSFISLYWFGINNIELSLVLLLYLWLQSETFDLFFSQEDKLKAKL